MAKMIFVNLPVTDLPRSMKFYEAVGFSNNPMAMTSFPSDETRMIVGSFAPVVGLRRDQ